MPITGTLMTLAQEYKHLYTAEDKNDHTGLGGAINDALIEAGYPSVALFHFGDAMGKKKMCQPRDACLVITSVLRNEEDTLDLLEKWYSKVTEETDLGEYEAQMLIEVYKTTRKKK